MKIVYALVVFAGAALAQECGEQFFNAAVCLKTKAATDILVMAPTKMQEWQTKTDECFAASSCAPPKYDADIFEGIPEPWADILKSMKTNIDNLSDEQQACVRDQMKQKMYKKLEECIGGPLPEPPAGKEWPKPDLSGPKKEALKRVIKMKVNFGKALRQCKDKVEDIMKCKHDNAEMKGLQEKSCAARQTCASENLDDTCSAEVMGKVDKVCQCAEDMKNEKKEMMEELKATVGAGKGPGVAGLRKFAGKSAQFKKMMSEMLSQCNIDEDKLTGNVKDKLKSYYEGKLKDGSSSCDPNGPLGVMLCVAGDLKAKRSELEPVHHLMHDYMEAFMEAGQMHSYCKCGGKS